MAGFSALTLAQKILRRFPFARLDVNCLNCLEYYPPQDEAGAVGDAILIREATPIDIEGLAACGNFPQRLRERFDAQERCVVGIRGGKVIGYQWFCEKPFRTEERYGYLVEIPADAIYGYDAFVLSNYRRARVWARFHNQYLKSLLGKLGRTRVIVMVDHNNSVSMKAHLHLGYRAYRKVYIFVAFGKCFRIKKAIGAAKTNFTEALRPISFEADPKQRTGAV